MEHLSETLGKIKVVQEALFFRQSYEVAIDRPTQAWQWMVQSRSVPEQEDWVRVDVYHAWQRCLIDYNLVLGNYSNWDKYIVASRPRLIASDATNIATQIMQMSHHFQTFLNEAGIMMVVVAPDGQLEYVAGEEYFTGAFQLSHQVERINWKEPVFGNNGIGTAIELKKPIAFQGMEHYLSILHPYTTVGYPLLDESGELLAVIGLVSDHQERMSSLFAFLHMICVLLNNNLPIAKSEAAQVRVLEKIAFRPAKKINTKENASFIAEELKGFVKKSIKLQKYKLPILITGESGVGKDHFVNLIKQAGPRKNEPLVAINCSSIPSELIESELFGYEAGSFTGAKAGGKPGKFLLADKGILFLDEIGDMSIDLQSTLLRVLESSSFTPVGGDKAINVDVQIIAATNVKLIKAIEAGRFRRDLYYRLNGAQIHLPTLRERADKLQIIQHIIQREVDGFEGDTAIRICPTVIALFEKHPWPGNIRQLINVVRSTIYTAASPFITQRDLPLDFMEELSVIEQAVSNNIDLIGRGQVDGMSLADWEKHGIKAALQACEGNISMASKMLGITRTTLYKKIKRFELAEIKVLTQAV